MKQTCEENTERPEDQPHQAVGNQVYKLVREAVHRAAYWKIQVVVDLALNTQVHLCMNLDNNWTEESAIVVAC